MGLFAREVGGCKHRSYFRIIVKQSLLRIYADLITLYAIQCTPYLGESHAACIVIFLFYFYFSIAVLPLVL